MIVKSKEVRVQELLKPKSKFPDKDLNYHQCHITHKTPSELKDRQIHLEKWLNERIKFFNYRNTNPEWVNKFDIRYPIYKIGQAIYMLLEGDRYSADDIGDDPDAPRPRPQAQATPVVAVGENHPDVSNDNSNQGTSEVAKSPSAPPQTLDEAQKAREIREAERIQKKKEKEEKNTRDREEREADRAEKKNQREEDKRSRQATSMAESTLRMGLGF